MPRIFSGMIPEASHATSKKTLPLPCMNVHQCTRLDPINPRHNATSFFFHASIVGNMQHTTLHPSESSLSMPNPAPVSGWHFFSTWPCFSKLWMSSVSVWRGLHTLNLFSCDGHVETIAFKVTIALPFSPAGTAGSDLRKSKEKLAEENREKVSKDKWSVQKDRRRVNCDWRQDSWDEAGRV